MLARMRIAPGFCLLWALALAACSSAPERRPALGEAFIGPAEYELRESLTARSPVRATLRHGERVEIIGRRRRFYQIRAASGAEGWIDGRLLLSAADLEALRSLSSRAAEAPSQGRATVLDDLNVHTAPYRQAPSFRRIRPGQHADVIAYERVERRPYEPAPLIQASPGNGAGRNGSRTQPGKKRRDAGPPPLAPVPAPGLPDNWLALSRPAASIAPEPDAQRPAPQDRPAAPADEWALVRLEDGAAGWVLARMLFMEIPDEVAQYAERARIMAYFQIGSVRGREGGRPVWLWAAQSQRSAESDFDSLRIFVWSVRRHRYETAFIERNLKGWLPLRLRSGATGVEGFDVVVEEKGGAVVRRSYSIQPGAFRARLAAKAPAARPPSWLEQPRPAAPRQAPPETRSVTWLARLLGWAGQLRGRFSR